MSSYLLTSRTLYSPIFPFLRQNETKRRKKLEKKQRNKISTSEWGAKHSFAGQNIKHSLSWVIIIFGFKPIFLFILYTWYNFDRCQKSGYLRQITIYPKKTIIAHAELQIWIFFTLMRIFKVGKKEKLNMTTKAHLIKQDLMQDWFLSNEPKQGKIPYIIFFPLTLNIWTCAILHLGLVKLGNTFKKFNFISINYVQGKKQIFWCVV